MTRYANHHYDDDANDDNEAMKDGNENGDVDGGRGALSGLVSGNGVNDSSNTPALPSRVPSGAVPSFWQVN